MRRLAFLLAVASLAGILLAQLLWGKQKCHTGCVTVNPAPPGCQVQCEWASWTAECFHPLFYVQHREVSRTRDIYEWQCVLEKFVHRFYDSSPHFAEGWADENSPVSDIVWVKVTCVFWHPVGGGIAMVVGINL